MKITALIVALAVAAIPAISVAQNNPAQIITNDGPPVNGTNEVQTITIGGTPTGGTFTLSIPGGRTTNPIAWSATNATLVSNIDAALEALNYIGAGGVTTAVGTMTSGVGTITVTFTGRNAKRNVPQLVATSSLTGTSPTVAVSTTTPGVDATFRDAVAGVILIDTATPDIYFNDSTTPLNPAWVKVSP